MTFPSLACGSEESAKGINSAPKSFPVVFFFIPIHSKYFGKKDALKQKKMKQQQSCACKNPRQLLALLRPDVEPKAVVRPGWKQEESVFFTMCFDSALGCR